MRNRYKYDTIMEAIVDTIDGTQCNVAIIHNHRQANYIIDLLNEKEDLLNKQKEEIERLKKEVKNVRPKMRTQL